MEWRKILNVFNITVFSVLIILIFLVLVLQFRVNQLDDEILEALSSGYINCGKAFNSSFSCLFWYC